MNKPDEWLWTVMLRLPEFVTPNFFEEVINEIVDKKQSDIYKKTQISILP